MIQLLLHDVKQLIDDTANSAIVAMTTDMWTDNYRRRSYAAFTLHFCYDDYEMKSMTLKTALFEEDHTGEKIKQEMEPTATEFGIQSKKIIYVTDNGSYIVKACRLAKVERLGCIAHGLHNLITVDGIAQKPEIKAVVDIAKDIVKKFVTSHHCMTTKAKLWFRNNWSLHIWGMMRILTSNQLNIAKIRQIISVISLPTFQQQCSSTQQR
jgi:hypothetical protein